MPGTEAGPELEIRDEDALAIGCFGISLIVVVVLLVAGVTLLVIGPTLVGIILIAIALLVVVGWYLFDRLVL